MTEALFVFLQQVVVKFIRKEKVLKDSWIDDPCMGRIPYEVYLLANLRHPNIVTVSILLIILFAESDLHLIV